MKQSFCIVMLAFSLLVHCNDPFEGTPQGMHESMQEEQYKAGQGFADCLMRTLEKPEFQKAMVAALEQLADNFGAALRNNSDFTPAQHQKIQEAKKALIECDNVGLLVLAALQDPYWKSVEDSLKNTSSSKGKDIILTAKERKDAQRRINEAFWKHFEASAPGEGEVQQ